MLAIAFLCFILGWVIGKAFGSPHPLVHHTGDYIAGALYMLALILGSISIFKFLWTHFS